MSSIVKINRRATPWGRRRRPAGASVAASYDETTADKEMPVIVMLLIAIVPVLLWAAVNAPHVSQTFASLLAAAALLEVVAPDGIRFGRRIVGTAFCISAAGFMLYGAPVAVLIGCVRGIVRALKIPAARLCTAQAIAWSILAPLFASLLAVTVTKHSAAWAGAIVFVIASFGLELFAAAAGFARTGSVSSSDAWRGFFPWPPVQYGAYGVIGYALAGELSAGHLGVLLFLAVPFGLARASLGSAGWGTEKYVALLERENDTLLNRIGQFDRANGDLIEALAIAIDEQDNAERGRTNRIAQISSRIGSALGITGWNLEVLRRAALLHDVGVLALGGGERGAAHCELGARFVARWRDGRVITKVIEQHHERLDGSGYPRGLKGEQIVLEARIVAVAEAFVELTSGPTAQSTLDALAEIGARRGLEFDPQVVDTLAQAVEPRTADVLPMTRRVR
ncbi:MAG: HD domain-containing protein [Candidatus Eremiobacteraeota bacterium]|nr:HD domain-containing protein [Candidatus Eremiobacteraeota bacterium]